MSKYETIALSEECSAIIQHRIPPKLKDPESFTLPCFIGNLNDINCLIDSIANINLIPLPLYRKLGLGVPKATSIILQLADRSLKHPYGIVEDMLIKAENLALLDFDANEIILRIEDKKQSFTMENVIKQPSYFEDCQRVFPSSSHHE
ncbi:uncharacterized protein LOC111366842 [Olea europaea var. sylvestris]|uniref:uncharacterized protein LOC111366842 n=1 Tax=Olea europaea var. sylvestris TaxID=158386 RepID=UPI000C1D6ECD|nr:uncharacterized protein LOC111366842 [Olea europaea var. sylvestris]